jgi:hypothetical protein
MLPDSEGKDDQDSPAGMFKHVNSDTIIAEPHSSSAGGQRMDRNPHGHSQLLAHRLLCGVNISLNRLLVRHRRCSCILILWHLGSRRRLCHIDA